MNKLIFRAWAKLEDRGWELIERTADLKLRPRPQWIPRWLWGRILNKLFYLEAILEAPNGYIADETVTVEEKNE